MKRFLTSQEAANYIGVSEAEFQNLVDKAEIPVYKVGGVYTRFKVDDLDLYNKKLGKKNTRRIFDGLKDFFYFNDFYIVSAILILVLLYFIFK